MHESSAQVTLQTTLRRNSIMSALDDPPSVFGHRSSMDIQCLAESSTVVPASKSRLDFSIIAASSSGLVGQPYAYSASMTRAKKRSLGVASSGYSRPTFSYVPGARRRWRATQDWRTGSTEPASIAALPRRPPQSCGRARPAETRA